MNLFQNWFLASRPWSFTMTAISVSVGSVLAALSGHFSWYLYVITLMGMVILHAATNLINDYYDVRSGVDRLEVSTAKYRPHPLLEGKLKPLQVRNVAVVLYCLAALSGTYLAMTRGSVIVVMVILGAVASLFYTAPPFKYKYNALGELSVFLVWGPLMVEGSYFVQMRKLSPEVLFVSLPFGILVALVLLINNTRDIAHDRINNIRTLPIMIGQRNSIRLFMALIILAYLSILVMSILGPLHLWSLMVLVSLPLSYRLFKRMGQGIPLDADARTAQLNTAFGVLLVISLITERIL
jgi:1,4-dihydroxy-2-naphthoate octaprenyltransferase